MNKNYQLYTVEYKFSIKVNFVNKIGIQSNVFEPCQIPIILLTDQKHWAWFFAFKKPWHDIVGINVIKKEPKGGSALS